MVQRGNPEVCLPKSIISSDHLEFLEIRRQQKVKLARERVQSTTKYRQSGNEVYHAAQRSTITTSHEFSLRHLPKSEAASLITPTLNSRHQPTYSAHINPSHTRYDTTTEHSWANVAQDWRAPSNSSVLPPSTRWSPDNYHDLQTRHPSFAKDLLLQPDVRANVWKNDPYEAGYGHGPNGAGIPRSYGQKEI